MKQLIVILIFFLTGCGDSDNYDKVIRLDSVQNKQDKKALNAALDVALETINSAYDGMRTWNYVEKKDEVTGDSIHAATIFSMNFFHL